jgi:hypothetical protein
VSRYETDVPVKSQPGANRFGRAIGTLDRLIQYAKAAGHQYLRGQRQAQLLYGSG